MSNLEIPMISFLMYLKPISPSASFAEWKRLRNCIWFSFFSLRKMSFGQRFVCTTFLECSKPSKSTSFKVKSIACTSEKKVEFERGSTVDCC